MLVSLTSYFFLCIFLSSSIFTVTLALKMYGFFPFSALTFFSSPLIGMKSDRSTFSVGRRRPVMILGAIALWYVTCNRLAVVLPNFPLR